ncbi:MAG TPA: helix-turn-helix domain-containing protein [Pseudonocardia sp.]
MRTYDDPCGVARALDLVGERWALLLVRELLLGPKRFTDLARGLPGMSQNVLAQRVRELEESGIVRRRVLGPPVGTRVYELTARGAELEAVLLELSRWGSRQPLTSDAELSVDALALALRVTFRGDGLRAQIGLRLGDDVLTAWVDGDTLLIARREPDTPDAVITSDVASLRGAVFGGEALPAEVTGDRAVAERFVRLFPRPSTH